MNLASKIYAWSKRNVFLLIVLLLGTAFVPLMVPPPGINTPSPVGKFLDGNLPNITPSNGGPVTYGVSPAYPNLSFNSPLVIEMHPQADTLFVASRDGLIEYFHADAGVTTKTTLLDLRPATAVVWDGGFLGLAFHPEFGVPTSANKNYFYVFYCAKGPQGQAGPAGPIAFTCENNPTYEGSYMILSRFEVQTGTLNVVPNSEQVMIKLRLYNSTHRGGGLLFGNDDMLYLTLGEQARYTTSQNIYSNFEGGTIRIDVDQNTTTGHAPIRKMGTQTGPNAVGYSDEFTGVGYTIPNDNPWQDNTGGTFEEFWSTGHRNPHRMTLDKPTGDIWIGEIGGGQREEINLLEKAKNYGWPKYEGNLQGTTGACGSNTMALGPGTYQPPVVDFLRSETNCIIGGYVYRGAALSGLVGNYICGGYSQNRIFSIENNGGTWTKSVIANFGPGGLITFGQDDTGELLLGKQGNNVTLYRLTAANAGPPAPQWLSQTGAFSNLTNLTPASGVIPYEMVEPFWSDGSDKFRWLAVPNDEDGNGIHDKTDEKIVWSENGEWVFPKGSVLIKHFELGNKRLETRFEVLGDNDVYYYLTYKWNAAGTDAQLLSGSLDEVVNVNGTNQTWHYPSRDECLSCHQASVGSVLGPKTRHLNKAITYPISGISSNQLVTLSHLGILDQTINDPDVGNYLTLEPKTNGSASLEDKARSYLDVNCSHCHRPETGNRAAFDARYTTPLALQNYINGSVINTLGITDARVIVPQDTGKSILYQRLNDVGNTAAMPPLAKNVLDVPGVELIRDWINSLAPVAPLLPLVTNGSAGQLPGGCYELTSATNNQAGTIWYPVPVDLSQDVTASFSLGLGSNDGGADGASFVFQKAGTAAIGGLGTGHGVSGINPSVGVAFDTYGQSNDEIFVWQNGNMNSVIASRVCASPICDDIENGGSHTVQIQWTASTQTLDVYFGGLLRKSYTGDIVTNNFSGDPWVFVGIGAGTGGLNNQHTVCNFNLIATFPPEPVVPNGDGMTATYYNNMNFTGSTVQRVDANIDFNWGNGSPDPSIGNNTFSARWEGGIVAPYTGTFTFYTNTDDGVRLWVDNQLVIDQWIDQAPTEWSGTISLTAGQLVPFKMEYYENGGGAVAQLSWSSDFLGKQIVAQANLFQVGSTFPVEWMFVEAEAVQDGVVLQWGTSQEFNNKVFTVEKSADGVNFEPVTDVPSQGNSQVPQYYQTIDHAPYFGRNIYRIRQTDFDGAFSYSTPVETYFSAMQAQVRAYPNPVSPGGTLNLEINSLEQGPIAITLLDMNGKRIFHERRYMDQALWTSPISTRDLAIGMYILHVQGSNWQKEERILIH